MRPVRVSRVESTGELLRVTADSGSWLTRTIVNATGTWDQPFIPYYPGIEKFRGRQLHTVDYTSPEDFAGKRVRQGLPPQSIVSVTGSILREQEQAAKDLGAYERRPMFDHLDDKSPPHTMQLLAVQLVA